MKRLTILAIGFLLIHEPFSLEIAADDCDRKCLVSKMNRYIAALTKRDPAGITLDRNVKFVENTEKMAVGAGLWKTISAGPKDFKIYAADPIEGQVGFIGVIEEEGKPVLAALRLKLVNGRITEIDHLVHHATRQPLNKNLFRPRAALVQPVKQFERTPRDQMLRIANSYYDAVVRDSGAIAPFAEECMRRENGMTTANDSEPPAKDDDFIPFRTMRCSDQIDTGVWDSITAIEQRRLLIADEEMGLVFAFSILVHDGEPKVMKIKGVPGVTERPNIHGAFDLVAAHIFKIRSGKIHDVEAIGYMGKHGVKNGWD